MKKNIIAGLAIGAAALSLMAQNYKVVVTTTEGVEHTYETTGVNKILFEEAPVYLDANVIIGTEYRTYKDVGCYYLLLSNAEPAPDGSIAGIAEFQLALELNAEVPEDLTDIQLPTGYYQVGDGLTPGKWDVQKSGLSLRLLDGEDGVAENPFIGGTIDVRKNGETYDIRAELNLVSGERFNARYQGELNFRVSAGSSLPLDKDVDVAWTGANGRYYANWTIPFADDITFNMYNGEFDQNGSQVEGYWLTLSLYMPKSDDPMNPEKHLIDGVYSVEPRAEVEYYTYLPYTFMGGRFIDFMGIEYPIDSTITYIDKRGNRNMSFINGGTITVSENGSKIECDLLTKEGKKVTGTYYGKVDIINKCDNDVKEPEIPSTLTGDYTLDYSDGEAIALCYPMGNYIKENLNNFILMVTEPGMTKGDYLSFELMCEGDQLANGTYTIDNNIENFHGLIGTLDMGGNMVFSWFGDLDSADENGYQETLSPISGGTVKIDIAENGDCTLVCDLETPSGYKITGEYVGAYIDASTIQPSAKKVLKLRKK